MFSFKLKFLAPAICAGCFLAPGLFAQDYRPGYIITAKGDSISGLTSYKGGKKNAFSCVFKTSKKSNPIRYTPNDLLAYGYYGDKSYVSATLPDNLAEGKVFLLRLAKGPLSLYRFGKFYLVKKEIMQLLPVPKEKKGVNKDDQQVTQKDNRYVGMLNVLISDCGMSAEGMSYSDGDLTNLVNNYNRCKGQTLLFNTRLKPLFKMNGNLLGSFIQSNLKMDFFEDVTFDPARTFGGGAGFEISSPRVFDRLFLSVDVWYVKTFYQAYSEVSVAGGLTHKDIFFDVSYIKPTLGLRYNFRQGNSTPYIKAGIMTGFLRENKIRTTEEREVLSDKTVFSSSSEGGYEFQRPKGFWGSVGYARKVSGKFGAFVEFRYENSEGYIGTPIQSFSRMTNYNLLLGISF